jgi:tetratricopeptide (TPR) repeat protein
LVIAYRKIIVQRSQFMRMRSRVVAVAVGLLISAGASAQEALPLTTKSEKARKLYLDAIRKAENFHNVDAELGFIAAAKADPNFAMAHAHAVLITRDQKVEGFHLAKAKAAGAKASEGEQLFVKWATAQKENDFVTAIAAMNDLMAAYPKDKQTLFFFSKWLLARNNNERCISLIENQILKIDPDYVPALNELGYAYSYLGEHDKAIVAMRRTTELKPGEPNPHDSLAELLRLAGRYEESLQHYQEANKIFKDFSSLGVADTLAMMGKYADARAEYARGAAVQESPRDAMDYKFQNGVSYIREKDFAGADKAFAALAEEAHKAGIADIEIDSHRAMAMYAAHPGEALAHLGEAERALSHGHALSKLAREEATAHILRQRVEWLDQAGRKDEAKAAVDQLAAKAGKSRNEVVQRSYHAANGLWLMSQGKLADAVPELQEDRDNAFSQRALIAALEKSGDAAAAKAERATMMNQHRVLVEDAVVASQMTK